MKNGRVIVENEGQHKLNNSRHFDLTYDNKGKN